MATMDLPSGSRYFMLRTGVVPAPGKNAHAEGKGNKKDDKKAARAAARGRGGKAQETQGLTGPMVATPDAASFGVFELIQSKFHSGRKVTPLRELNKKLEGQTVWVRARAHTVRGRGKQCFIVLREDLYTAQCILYVDAEDAKEQEAQKDMVKFASKIPTESIVDLQGVVSGVPKPVESVSQHDVEIKILKVFVVNPAKPLPFQVIDASRSEQEIQEAEAKAKDKDDAKLVRVNRDTRLDNRFIDLRTFANHSIFRVQAAVCRYFREFFDKKNFVEIHTPKIIPGSSEGGANVFKLNYFGSTACLSQSPQLYKQMSVIAGMSGVFEIGPVFRAEDSNTARHLCEFTGLDVEMEILEHYSEVLNTMIDMFLFIFKRLNETMQPELQAVNKQYPFEPLKFDKCPVIRFSEAVKMLRAEGMEIGDLEDFGTPHEKKLGEIIRKKYNTDIFVCERYPLSCRPFYTMPDPENNDYSLSWDVFLRGQEIVSGAQRVHDYNLLAERVAAKGMAIETLGAYTEAFKYGAPPHGGFGVGLERIVMLFLGLDDIRKSSLFPRDPSRCNP